MVHQHERRHRLDDDDRPRQHARIVTAARRQFRFRPVHIHGLLRLENRGGRLEGDAEDNLLAVADAALHAAGIIGGGANLASLGHEGVVVLRPLEQRAGETAADLEALGRGQGKHRLGKVSLEAVEHRRAEADGHAAHAAFDDAADGITLAARLLDALDHFLRGGRMQAADGRGFDIGQGRKLGDGRRGDVVDTRHVGADLELTGEMENFLGDDPGRHAADGLASGRTATAAVVAIAVLGLIGVVGVRGSVFLSHLVVSAGPLVGAAHREGDGHAGGETLKDAGENLDLVGFLARRRDVALAGAPPVEVGLDFRRAQRQARRAAVDDHAHGRPVAFAPGGDAEKLAKGIGHSARRVKPRLLAGKP